MKYVISKHTCMDVCWFTMCRRWFYVIISRHNEIKIADTCYENVLFVVLYIVLHKKDVL